MHEHFTLSIAAAVVEMLAAAGVLAYVAEKRQWQPPLWVALAVGLSFRLQLLMLTHIIKTYDIYYDYRAAGLAVLHHQDPILHTRPSGWSFLPLYGFVLAGETVLQHGLHVTWLYIGRLFAVPADLVVITLVGVVAGRRTGALRRFQYACYPLAIIDASGRMDVTCLALALAAFALLLHRRSAAGPGRALGAGALLGLAVGVNSWPILFLPGLWRALPSLRARLQATLGLAGVVGLLFTTMPLTVGTPVQDLARDARTILTYHGSIGDWGWSAVITDFYRLHWYSPASATIGTIGAVLTLAAILAAIWLWRRAHPVDLASVTPCALLTATASFGGQYLLWPVPFLLARPPKRAWWYHVPVNAWSIIALAELAFPRHVRHTANTLLIMASLLVIPAIVAAMPWERRGAATARPSVPPPRDGRRRSPGERQPDARLDRTGQPDARLDGTGQPDARLGGGGQRDARPADERHLRARHAGHHRAQGRGPVPGTAAFSCSAGNRDRPRWWPDRASGSLRPCPGCRS